MQPISQSNPNVHKGPSSSVEFNRIQNSMHYDINALFDVANKHDQEIKQNMDVLIRENFFLQNKINDLSQKLEKIKVDMMYKAQGLSKQQMIKSMYTVDDVVNSGTSQANLDTLYGVLTLPSASRTSKVSYQAEDRSVIVPNSLGLSLLESTDTQPLDTESGMRQYYSVNDRNLTKAFDKNNNTFWVRTASFPDESNVSEVFGHLTITLPLNILNNVYVNTLTLHPYPEYSMTIADIWYKGYDGTRHRLLNYPTTKDNMNQDVPVAIKGSGKLFFSFPKTEITEIQIFFSQPYWFSNEGNRDFTYGFQDIGVEYRDYSSTTAELVTEFSLEGTGKRFYNIDRPVVVPAIGTEQEINDLVEHKLYYSKALTSEFDFGNEILAPIQKVYVKTIIQGSGDIVPVIKDIALDYVYRDLNDM